MQAVRRKDRLFLVVMTASFLLNLAFGMYRSVFSNFAGQELGIGYAQYGLLEGIREIPGLVTIALVAIAARLNDERLYAVSAGLVGAGIWMYASAHTYADLVAATLIQSIGFHVWSVMQDSIVMKSTATEDRAVRLGIINSGAAGALVLGMGLVLIFGRSGGLRPFFLTAGVIGLAGALFALLMRPDRTQKKRVTFVFRWQYRSYYILTLLSGARRHIVLTFASFALVKLYGTSVNTMATLLMIHSLAAMFTRPAIGKVIDRVGEQRALSLNYAVVAVLFLSYALIRNSWIIYGVFILDNVMTGFDIAISTHAGRLIPREELSASLATGTSINHIFGVMVPVVGGVLWEWFGPVIPFLMGTAIVLIAMAYSWNLDSRALAANTALPAGSGGQASGQLKG